MKKAFIVIFLSLFILPSLNAQTSQERAQTLSASLEKNLALTPDQKTKVYDLIAAKLETIDKLSKDQSSKEAQAELRVEKRKYLSEVRGVLTEEQYKKWMTMRKQQMEGVKKGVKVDYPVYDPIMENEN